MLRIVVNYKDQTHRRMLAQPLRSWSSLFSDVAFQGDVPDDGGRDEHLPHNKLYALRQGRVAIFMKDKWRSLGVRYEVAWHRYSAVSGTDGNSCFCGCGKLGFWTTSGFVPSYAN
jgi:hypothetical protein